MLNNSGPSMEPCGIPVVEKTPLKRLRGLVKLDLVSPKITNCFRPVR